MLKDKLTYVKNFKSLFEQKLMQMGQSLLWEGGGSKAYLFGCSLSSSFIWESLNWLFMIGCP